MLDPMPEPVPDSMPDPLATPPEPVVLYVCTTCRAEGDGAEIRAGARLMTALAARLGAAPVPGLRIEPVECLSVCKRPCTVALSSPTRVRRG